MARHFNWSRVIYVESYIGTEYKGITINGDYKLQSRSIVRFKANFQEITINDLTKEEYLQALYFQDLPNIYEVVQREVEELEKQIIRKEWE